MIRKAIEESEAQEASEKRHEEQKMLEAIKASELALKHDQERLR